MRKPRFLTVLFVVFVLALAAVGWSDWWRDHQALRETVFVRQRVSFLEAENQRLRESLARNQQLVASAEADAQRRKIESAVVALRQLNFLAPVNYEEIPRSQLPAILRQKLSQQVPDQEFGQTSVALATLGLIPHGLDLKKTYLGLLGEQVGAFYDQHSKELFTFSGQPLAETQNQVILAHELTHALEDQHFHLERLPLEAKGNDDRALAASALVEGDATLVMNQYMVDHLTAASLRETLATTLTTDLRQLAAAPRYMRETLLFPYMRGQEFCQELYAHGGWPELARAFAQPPASTSQILHPERFLAQPREDPVTVNFPTEAILGKQAIADNVLGEFGLRQLLGVWLKDEQRAAEMASGWHGDRYVVFGDAQAASYAWEIDWRHPGEAQRFAVAVSRALGGNAASSTAQGAAVPTNVQERTWAQGDRRFSVVAISSQQRTFMINAQDPGWYEALKSRFADRIAPSDSRPKEQP